MQGCRRYAGCGAAGMARMHRAPPPTWRLYALTWLVLFLLVELTLGVLFALARLQG